MSDTGLSGKDITYETHVADGQQLDQPEPEKPEQPELKPERAPISWLRQVAAEIEAKKGNPNPGRTRQSSNGLGLSPSARHTMSESTTGKLHQKDYTPEVDELLPQATSLAQVRFPSLAPMFPLTPQGFILPRLASSRRHWTSSSRSRNKQEMFVFAIFEIFHISNCISGLGSEVNDATRRNNNRARIRRTRVCTAQLEYKRVEQETRSVERRDSGYGRASHVMAG